MERFGGQKGMGDDIIITSKYKDIISHKRVSQLYLFYC